MKTYVAESENICCGISKNGSLGTYLFWLRSKINKRDYFEKYQLTRLRSKAGKFIVRKSTMLKMYLLEQVMVNRNIPDFFYFLQMFKLSNWLTHFIYHSLCMIYVISYN